MWTGSRLMFLLLSPLLATVASAQAKDVCYGSTGNEDPNLGVCDPTAAVSACCPYGEMCYSNGLCQRPGVTSVNSTVYTIYSVHGCTRNGASTGDCFVVDKCLSKGVGVTVCGANTYCCYGLRSCDCKNSTQVFSLPSGTILTTLPVSPSTALSSTRSTTRATTSPTTVPVESATATTSPTGTTTPTAVPNPSGNGNNSVAIGAGVGVGAGVALILLAGLAFFFWRRRQRRQKVFGTPSVNQSSFASPQQSYAAEPKYGASAVYSPVAQNNPDGPDSYNHVQPTSELEASRPPVKYEASELEGSRVPVTPTDVKPAQYR